MEQQLELFGSKEMIADAKTKIDEEFTIISLTCPHCAINLTVCRPIDMKTMHSMKCCSCFEVINLKYVE